MILSVNYETMQQRTAVIPKRGAVLGAETVTGAEEVVQEVEIVVEEGVEVENDVTKRKSANQVVQKDKHYGIKLQRVMKTLHQYSLSP